MLKFLLFGLALLLAACANVVGATPPTITVQPEAIFEQLYTHDSLDKTVAQFAELLEIDPSLIQARIVDTSICTLCEMQDGSEPVYISAEEAVAQAAPGSAIWLRVSNFTCAYFYHMDQIIPQQCSRD